MATVRLTNDSDNHDLVPIDTSEKPEVKKSFGRKFVDAFISGSARDVRNYIFFSFIDWLKDTAVDSFKTYIYGDASVRRGRSRGSMYASENRRYSAYYQSELDDRRGYRYRTREEREYFNRHFDYHNIMGESLEDAKEIIWSLREKINKYPERGARRSDLYELIEKYNFADVPEPTKEDRRLGWTDPNQLNIRRLPNGMYLLDLDDVEELQI